jgi:hypothetical protein
MKTSPDLMPQLWERSPSLDSQLISFGNFTNHCENICHFGSIGEDPGHGVESLGVYF